MCQFSDQKVKGQDRVARCIWRVRTDGRVLCRHWAVQDKAAAAHGVQSGLSRTHSPLSLAQAGLMTSQGPVMTSQGSDVMTSRPGVMTSHGSAGTLNRYSISLIIYCFRFYNLWFVSIFKCLQVY